MTAVRSCHGAGKSFAAAAAVCWFLRSFPESLVITTAPTGRQVKAILWQEIAQAHARATRELGGHLTLTEWHLAPGWFAFGFATDIPDNFQGLHARHILAVVDEAGGVARNIMDAVMSVLTSQDSRLLAIGNPTDPTGSFYELCRDAGSKCIAISAFDTPNLTVFGITEQDIIDGAWRAKVTGPYPYPKLVTPEWVERALKRWGRESPMYQSRVLGNFPAQGTDNLIPLHWAEAAQQRWAALPDDGLPRELGGDVARFGDDESAVAHRAGRKLLWVDIRAKQDTMQTTGWFASHIRATKSTVMRVDEVGVGAGVLDRLAEQGLPVVGVNVGQASSDPERFLNLRAELYWTFREFLDPDGPDPIGLPPDDQGEAASELVAQLTSIKYKYTSRGQIAIESKEDMKKRGLPSPDLADAAVLAFVGGGSHIDPAAAEILRALKVHS